MQGYDQFAAVKAVEHFLERLVSDYGLELYLAFSWLSFGVIAWIIVRNLLRRDQRRSAGGPSIIIVPTAFTGPPPVISSSGNPPDLPPFAPGDNEGTAFPA